MKNTKQIIIADDHPLVLIGLKEVLRSDHEFEIVGEAKNGDDLFKLLGQHQCDILITDLMMPLWDGIQSIEQVKRLFPDMKIIILSQVCEQSTFNKAISIGVSGFLSKEDCFEMIQSALRSVVEGKKIFSPKIQTELIDAMGFDLHLTEREKEVLSLLAKGHNRDNISDLAGISIRTVDFHIRNLKDKFYAKNIVELLNEAKKKNLLF